MHVIQVWISVTAPIDYWVYSYSHDVEGDHDGEHGVWPAGLSVHVGGRHCPGLVAVRHEVLNPLSVQHRQLGQTLHVGPEDLVLSDEDEVRSCADWSSDDYLTFRPFFFPLFAQSSKSKTFSLYISM